MAWTAEEKRLLPERYPAEASFAMGTVGGGAFAGVFSALQGDKGKKMSCGLIKQWPICLSAFPVRPEGPEFLPSSHHWIISPYHRAWHIVGPRLVCEDTLFILVKKKSQAKQPKHERSELSIPHGCLLCMVLVLRLTPHANEESL